MHIYKPNNSPIFSHLYGKEIYIYITITWKCKYNECVYKLQSIIHNEVRES